MAFLWMDGFDHYTSVAQMYSIFDGNCSIHPTAGRRGGPALQIGFVGSPGAGLSRLATPGDTKCINGFAYKRSDTTASVPLKILDGSGNVQGVLRAESDGSVTVYRGDSATLLGATAAGIFDYTAGFHYFELEYGVHSSTGTVKLAVNGTLRLNLTAQNTQGTGATTWGRSQLYFRPFSPGVEFFDDWYLFDGTGTVNNAIRGDSRVDSQFPTANGNTSNSTPSTGTNRALTIDEVPPNGDTDYNTLTAVNDLDTLVLADQVNAGKAIAAVQVHLFAKKTTDGTGLIAPVLRVGSTDYVGAGQALDSATYGYKSQGYDKDPSGAAWTEATFNALEVGYKRTA